MLSSQLIDIIQNTANSNSRRNPQSTTGNLSGNVIARISNNIGNNIRFGQNIVPQIPPVITPTPIQKPEFSVKDSLVFAFEKFLQAARVNGKPTHVARLLYIWFTVIAYGYSWIKSPTHPSHRLVGTIDNLKWSTSQVHFPDGSPEEYVWMIEVLKYIMASIKTNYKKNPITGIISNPPGIGYTITGKPTGISSEDVKEKGKWSSWKSMIDAWMVSRENDGYQEASDPPSNDVLPNGTKSVIIDNGKIEEIANLQLNKSYNWTPLEFGVLTADPTKRNRQKYLTYNWGSVRSSVSDTSQNLIIEEAEKNFYNRITGQPHRTIEQATILRNQEIDNVLTLSGTMTSQQKIIAEFWAGGPGTVSPPGQFGWLWKEYIKVLSPPTDICIYSGLDLGIHLFEGSIITWKIKRKNMEARPVQEIRLRYGNTVLTSWDGKKDGCLWVPYQESNFITPPFSDFPSGHSHFSAGFANTMKSWFGPSIQKGVITNHTDLDLLSPFLKDATNSLPYATFVIPKKSSAIQVGVPETDLTLTWDTWDEMATGEKSSGNSRFYGGIHALSAHTGSQVAAGKLHEDIKRIWNIVGRM